jgi:type VI secretion system protein ImpA
LLDQGDWVTERKQADWNLLHKNQSNYSQKIKDIRLFTWLTEGLANLYGFQGIAKGLELCSPVLNRLARNSS